MITKITRAYVCHYSDNGQTSAYVEGLDEHGKCLRVEAPTNRAGNRHGWHMSALLARAVHEGLTIERETW